MGILVKIRTEAENGEKRRQSNQAPTIQKGIHGNRIHILDVYSNVKKIFLGGFSLQIIDKHYWARTS